MAQETKQNQGQLPCTTGCGFYGNPQNDGMCSVCYKDFLQRENSNERTSPQVSSATVSSIEESLLAQCSESRSVDAPSASPHTDTATGHSSVASSQTVSTHSGEETATGAKVDLKTEELQDSVSVSEDSDQVDGQEDKSSDDKPKAKKSRCFTCRKKLGLTGFDCRCGQVFCGMHRYSDIHNCTFDYKADAAEKIRRENPVCVGEKIQKI